MRLKVTTYGILMAICFNTASRQVRGDDLPTCQAQDFHYEYTECDSEGGRWRVSVPKPNVCVHGAPNPPVRGKDCSFTCTTGQYLDLNDQQECKPCPVGTYSLGGGMRFDDWEKLPDAFSVSSESLDTNIFWHYSAKKENVNCTKSLWRPRGAYIYTQPGSCTSTLTYSAKLVKPGLVTFEYQYSDPQTLFHVTVQNDQCQAATDDNVKWPELSEEGKWGSLTLKLNSGMNVIQWRVIGALSDSIDSQKPVLIRKIEITGVAYTSECTKCRNGTYSSGGTAFCAPCKANMYSGRGAAQCEPCKENEYSEVGSAFCTVRPPCTLHDYYEIQTPCDSDKKTQKVYKWIEPKICNENIEGSVSLPPSTEKENCPPCNPGMYPVNASWCEFCPEGHYSDGALECQPCPVSTSPEYGIHYKWWSTLPPNVTSHCIAVGVGRCSESASWLPAGDYIRTNFGPSDRSMFLILSLHIEGLRGEPSDNDEKAAVFGQLKFTFEVHCTADCELVFLTDVGERNSIVKSWRGSLQRQEFEYDIHTNKPFSLTWAFQPTSNDIKEGDDEDKPAHNVSRRRDISFAGLDSIAKIFSIQVTNTVGGGATKCMSCPKGTSDKGCVPCPDGQYIDTGTTQCQECPEKTILPSSNAWGKESCKECGEGLKAFKKRVCKSDCTFTDKAGRFYDFSPLDGIHYVQGGRLFTASGTMYYHGFNITLCNKDDRELPSCVSNVTVETQKNGTKTEEVELLNRASMMNLPSKVSGMVCRSTFIPQTDGKKPLVSTQPVILATRLTKIVTNESLAQLYTTEGFPTDASLLDVHFYYTSEIPTQACPKGRTTIISLTCDPDERSNNSILLPPKCSDGTCDGCTFHFLWRSQHGCPRCAREDYDVIRGECVHGEQLIHYYPPKYCLPMSDEDMKPMKQKCQVLPFVVMVAIPVALAVGLFLILLLIYCWSRNKKLEYKYSKLVETAGGREGELPGVESCGMEEGEEEESVHFSNNRGPQLLKKIRLKISSLKNKFTMEAMSDEDDPFVAVKMHEKLPLT